MGPAPGGQVLHHAWLGGLLERRRWCGFAGRRLRFIRRWMRTAGDEGAILHDIGKIRELSWKNSFCYVKRADDRAYQHCSGDVGGEGEEIAPFSEKLRVLVEHMILSHHGKYEFGVAEAADDSGGSAAECAG